MKLDYSLNIKQTQKMMVSTKMIQEINILQYTVQELSSYVQEEMLINPVLEIKEELEKPQNDSNDDGFFNSKEALDFIKNKNSVDQPYKTKRREDDDAREYTEKYKQDEQTLNEYLKFQLSISAISKDYIRIGEYIIDTLDENGYMTSTIDDIVESLSCSKEKVKSVTRLIRTFDPAGVCAVDLKDCLLLQLRRLGNENELVEKVIRNHLEDVAENRIQLISKNIGISNKEVENIREIIKTLDPKPGSYFGNNEDLVYINPDVMITREKNGYKKEFRDDSVPSLMVSSYYKTLLENANEDKELEKYLTDKVNSALWIIKCIEKRQETIRNVIDAILEFQREFFEKGEFYLKPLTLKTVADYIGVHESTVSRTINGKYMQFEGEVLELKYFFKSGIGSKTGESISSTSVKASIKELIEIEDSRKPLSDQSIVDLLIKKGFDISRRTVTKYRESMDIPSSTKRRRY